MQTLKFRTSFRLLTDALMLGCANEVKTRHANSRAAMAQHVLNAMFSLRFLSLSYCLLFKVYTEGDNFFLKRKMLLL